jgi:XTP/dITP diphosphohydrolase
VTDEVRLTVVLATRNAHKVAEIVDAFALPGVTFVGVAECGDVPDVVEDGDTLEANARKKAREVCAATGKPALADDSGLLVHTLEGAPGVHSARFAGDACDDAANRRLLREKLAGVPEAERKAHFACVLALCVPTGEECILYGECHGRILDEERGDGGFGYDALFLPDGHQRTFAEIPMAEKAGLSHRGRALSAARRPMGRLLREWAVRWGGA